MAAYFEQAGPEHLNNILWDEGLQAALKHRVPASVLERLCADVTDLGERCLPAGDVGQLGIEANRPQNEPRLQHSTAFGERVDRIWTCSAWSELHKIAAAEGLIASGYDRSKHGEWSRLCQILKLYVFTPSSGMVSCPLAMTDGAARLIESQLKQWQRVTAAERAEEKAKVVDTLQRYFERLTSRDPLRAWTSGQWMTERTGGSDLGRTETVAVRDVEGGVNAYRLSGYKFFTSATTANITFALARIVDSANPAGVAGSRGLSLFAFELRDANGRLSGLRVHRMKDKLGTRSLPTAEIELIDKPALLVGEIGRGVANISALFNITRIHTLISSCATSATLLSLMKDFAKKRQVFGKLLDQQPLHLQTLADLEVQHRGLCALLVDVAALLGRSETENSDSDASKNTDSLLRLLIPLGKAFGSRLTNDFMLEAVESFGGQGYQEDSGVPVALRDCIVNSIWEGTTNVISLDVLRAMAHDRNALLCFQSVVLRRCEASKLTDRAAVIQQALTELGRLAPQVTERTARAFSFSLARTYVASLLLDQADPSSPIDILILDRWIQRFPLIEPISFNDDTASTLHSSLLFSQRARL